MSGCALRCACLAIRSLQHRGSREPTTGNGRVSDDAPPLLRVKEEGLVLDYRATQSEAEIVPAQRRPHDVVAIIEKVVGVQIIIAEELVSTAMELVSTTTRDHGYFGTGAAAVFGQADSRSTPGASVGEDEDEEDGKKDDAS